MNNVTNTLKEILDIPSPSGYTRKVNNYLKTRFDEASIPYTVTNKGVIIVSFSDSPKLVVTGHIDTLGGMVKQINGNGTLEITKIGGFPVTSFEGEYVSVRASGGKLIRGTFLINNPADHVNKEVGSAKRETKNMSVRLDAKASTSQDVKKLGIDTGDFVFFDNRYEQTQSGFIKSRFLDDKACAAIMIEIILELKKKKYKGDTAFFFSNYEEVGHGASAGIPASAEELLVLDMAVIGDGCTGQEDAVTICAKDSTGPYDFEMTEKLRSLAKKNKLNYVVDVYPYYGSDGSAARSAGCDVRVALIGPGVSASHGVERTHIKALEQTYKLTKLYIESADK